MLHKPIFVDIYTSWCGPCKVMAAQVFTRPEVGAKYNKGFVNVKIDAEKGEGIAIAKKYEVKSYPTYLFINPADESLIDRSKSSMAAADFNDVGDKMLFKFTGRDQIGLADLDAKYNTSNYDEAFAKAYIKRLKAEGKSTGQVLSSYITKFVSKIPSADQLYFIGLNFAKGADANLYKYMINNYKAIDAVLCKRDGVAGASLYFNLRGETIAKIEDALTLKNETQLDRLFADLNTVEIDERKNKKVLEFKIRLYTANRDTLQLLQAYRAYISGFLLPSNKTASIGRESFVLNKNEPVAVLPIDSVSASDWCSNYAIKLSKISKDVQDKKLTNSLFEKAITLNNSSVLKNNRNVIAYNFGDKVLAIKQQAELVGEMKNSNDESLKDAEATFLKMQNNESNLPILLYRRKIVKKH
ncbi:thioredoxin family protein [Pedobacter nutrimenti]|uniref:thioredoxin family protein n=1 Tax=Pedobacter nutrimenti TaxID=1241337 RepID=UPI00292EB428|nr:thioredoxin family protein [Pedobacter nutrimenti]